MSENARPADRAAAAAARRPNKVREQRQFGGPIFARQARGQNRRSPAIFVTASLPTCRAQRAPALSPPYRC